MQKQKISLSMVVKNRVLVLERCLLSVLPMIDYWIICDTGSTDGTQDLIRAFFSKHKLPGELHERPWVSLGHNRTEALELARPHSDYVLIMDADDRLEYTDTFKRLHLAADSYTIESVRDGQSSFRTQLVKSNRPWRYEGMSHEFLSYWDEIQQKHVFPETTTQKHLPHVVMRRGADGEGRAETADSLFKGDAEIVRAALSVEQDPFLISRYTFFLAQSLQEAGQNEAALSEYLKRTQLGFSPQEIYISYYHAAQLAMTLKRSYPEIIDLFERAIAADPTRAEAFHGAARYCRINKHYQQGFDFAQRALHLKPRQNALFTEKWIYDFGLRDEYAVNAYWVEDYHSCYSTCQTLLEQGHLLTESNRKRIEANAQFAADKLKSRTVKSQAHSNSSSPVEDAVTPVDIQYLNHQPRYAIVTPYYNEAPDILKRCMESVRGQTIPVDHFMIADGFPQEWISEAGVRHIKLDKPHADFGGTPRAIGCLLAISEGYDAIALLDADNWLEPDHIEHCLQTAHNVQGQICDYVVARLRIVRPDGSPMNISSENIENHVDTNCFVFMQGSYHTLPIWALMPKQASPVGDRFFYKALRELKLVRAVATKITVNYTSLWEVHYKTLGEAPPPGAKSFAGGASVTKWLRSLSPRQLEIAERLMHIKIVRD